MGGWGVDVVRWVQKKSQHFSGGSPRVEKMGKKCQIVLIKLDQSVNTKIGEDRKSIANTTTRH